MITAITSPRRCRSTTRRSRATVFRARSRARTLPRDRAINPGMSRSTALPTTSRVGRARPDFPLLYRALRTPVRGVLERWFGLTIEGHEHLPAHGPYLIAANHHNYLDGVVLAVSVPAPIAFLVMPRVWGATL